MWEAIRANRRRSLLLISGMAAVLVGLGYLIGTAIAPGYGLYGIAAALLVWGLLFVAATAGGRGILLGSVRARPITHDDAPMLFNVVEEMTLAAGLPKPPKVYIIDNDAPNAFAVGDEKDAAVAVTSGLLMRLNRDELQGVVAHEIGHIRNHDGRFMVQAGVMLAAIVILSDLFVRGMFYSGAGRSRRGGSRGQGGGQAQLVLLVAAIVFAILAPLLAQVLYFACSRKREYLADASAARFTRYPAGLASALEKIAGAPVAMKQVSRAVAPMFIINPLKASSVAGLFSTHPPTKDRVRILRSMAGGAGFAEYDSAYRQAHGGRGVLGARTLAEADQADVRQASAEPAKDDLTRAREAVDILHRTGGYLMLPCACGLKIKVPPAYRKDQITCPLCSKVHAVPTAALAGVLEAAEAADTPDAPRARPPATTTRRPAHFTHTPGQWSSFRCPCGGTVQVSPSFRGSAVTCGRCRRRIQIDIAPDGSRQTR